jgi:hypothetical protein
VAAFFISHSSHDRDTVQGLHGRLRAWGYDSLYLDFDPEDGVEVGQEWERELYRQLRIADAVLYVGSRAAAASRWCFAELTLARSANKPIFPLAIEQGSRMPLLEDRQWLDLTDGEAAFQRLRGVLHERFDPRDVFKWDLARAPYPGLTAFEAEDAAIFFARDDTIEELLGHLDATLGGGRSVAVRDGCGDPTRSRGLDTDPFTEMDDGHRGLHMTGVRGTCLSTVGGSTNTPGRHSTARSCQEKCIHF